MFAHSIWTQVFSLMAETLGNYGEMPKHNSKLLLKSPMGDVLAFAFSIAVGLHYSSQIYRENERRYCPSNRIWHCLSFLAFFVIFVCCNALPASSSTKIFDHTLCERERPYFVFCCHQSTKKESHHYCSIKDETKELH